jgi:hypothetical protein
MSISFIDALRNYFLTVFQEKAAIKYIDFVPEAPPETGDVTGGTITTLVDSTKTWTVNQWVDKVVKIEINGDMEYGAVLSNTADTLTFDDDLIFEPCVGCVYHILDTLVVTPEDLSVMVAVDCRVNAGGVLLPKATSAFERKYIHTYIEKSDNGNTIPIMSRGTDRQLGVKYGTLEHATEGVRLYAHTFLTDHWDIIQAYNIKRLASEYLDDNVALAGDTTDWQEIMVSTKTVTEKLKRFVAVVRDGTTWLRYTSLLPKDFFVSGVIQAIKTGGGAGECYATIRIKDGITGVESDYTVRDIYSRFGAGEGAQAFAVNIQITLKRNDEVTIIARRTAGTFSIGAGTSIDIQEA